MTDFEADEAVDDLGRAGEVGDGTPVVCCLFIFLAGGGLVSVEGEGFEGAGRFAREELGNCIPKAGSDSDFLRVLYGMMEVKSRSVA